MAHFFDGNGPTVYTATSCPLSGTPLTMACWFNAAGTPAARQTLMVVGGTSPNSDGHVLRLHGTSIEAGTESGAGPTRADAVASGAYSAGVWTHACGVWASATSRTAYRDGANAVTDSTNLTPTSTFTRTSMGNNSPHGGSFELYGNGASTGGDIAVPAIWNAALSPDDVAALASGVSPLLVRPDALVFYSPFSAVPANAANEQDLMQSLALQQLGVAALSTSDPHLFLSGRQPIAAPRATAVDTSHTIHVVLNGTDIAAHTHIKTLRIQEVASKAPNTAMFTVDGVTPAAGQTIKIYEGGTLRFGGDVLRATRNRRDAVTITPIYTVDCVDYTYKLGARLIQKVYTSQAADVVVKDIIDTYAPGITRANVDNLLATISIAFDFETVPTALDQIAALVSARWKVDYQGDLNFRVSSFFSSPSALTATPTYPFRRFGYEQDVTGIVTRLYMLGRSSSTTAAVAVSASSVPVSDTSIFQGSGTRKAVSGQNRLSYTGTSTASGPGNLTGVSGVTYAIAQGDAVALFAQVDDTTAQSTLAALDGTDGIREARFTDATVTTYANLVTKATAKLSLLSAVTETAEYTTEDPTTTPGADVTVNVDGVSTVLQIQRQDLWAIGDGATRPLQRDVTASTQWLDLGAFLASIAQRSAKIG